MMAGSSSDRRLLPCSGVAAFRPRVLLGAALVSTAASTLVVYPHQLAYFNELVGGPAQGYRHLLHSNLQWGQDLLLVQEWMRDSGIPPRRVMFVPRDFCPAGEVVTGHLPPGAARDWEIVRADQVFDSQSAYAARWQQSASGRIGYGMWVFHAGETAGRDPAGL